MVNIYVRAKSECHYNAAYFLQMVEKEGGLRSAKILLHKPDLSEGFTALWERGRLDLTVESLVLKEPWRALFTEQELKIARKRLEDLNASTSPTSEPRDRHRGQTSRLQSRVDRDRNGARTTLEKLERALRRFIEAKLSALTSNWWLERVPPDVRRRAEDRQHREETLWPWLSPTAAATVEFLDFSDYKKIITTESNWDEVFREDLVNREIIAAKFMELEPIRNTVAHHRDLSAEQLEVLRIHAKHIMALIKAE